jgi:hypothetical protein
MCVFIKAHAPPAAAAKKKKKKKKTFRAFEQRESGRVAPGEGE